MNNQFDGKVALVTGAGSGIGRATALVFAREGAKVVVDDINVSGGEETVQLIKKNGGEAFFFEADVTKANEVQALINKVVEDYGRLDFAHNNAGIEGKSALTADCSEESWDNVIATDLKGVWLCMKYEIPQMLNQGKGVIINTSSMRGLTGGNSNAAYVSAKHGVVGLTKTAALEYAKKGLRINAVCPGIIRTPMVERRLSRHPEVEAIFTAREPIGRLGKPEEIAETVVWLCSESAAFVTGLAMAVDGGVTAQ